MNGSLDIVKRFPIEKFRLVIEIQKPRESRPIPLSFEIQRFSFKKKNFWGEIIKGRRQSNGLRHLRRSRCFFVINEGNVETSSLAFFFSQGRIYDVVFFFFVCLFVMVVVALSSGFWINNWRVARQTFKIPSLLHDLQDLNVFFFYLIQRLSGWYGSFSFYPLIFEKNTKCHPVCYSSGLATDGSIINRSDSLVNCFLPLIVVYEKTKHQQGVNSLNRLF